MVWIDYKKSTDANQTNNTNNVDYYLENKYCLNPN